MVESGLADVARAVLEAYASGEMPRGGEDGFKDAWKGWVKALGKTLGRKVCFLLTASKYPCRC
jgi:hypothetical protein